MESPDKKEEKYVLKEQNIKFFSPKKIFKFFWIMFVLLFAAFGLLAFVNLTMYPDMGIIDLAKERTSNWRSAKEGDLGHEAIAFELMLDAYAKEGGDISHAMDSLTAEFTSANWAELLEYDVDYFLKHDELSDSIKLSGMLHLTKTLYTSGHYDLFKEGYKALVDKFAADRDYLTIYTNLLPLEATYQYDDDEEKEELGRLYELGLRRHLKVTASKIVAGLQEDALISADLEVFVNSLSGIFSNKSFLNSKSDKFKVQAGSDLSHLLKLISSFALQEKNTGLQDANSALQTKLAEQNLEFFDMQ